jgi:uncharacterized protein YdhG (YjbR/CyaY superfamily)
VRCWSASFLMTPKTVSNYIHSFPPDVRKKLRAVRQVIRKAATGAKETIKYQMPTYVLDGNLVYFAGYKHHIAIYPAPRAKRGIEEEIEALPFAQINAAVSPGYANAPIPNKGGSKRVSQTEAARDLADQEVKTVFYVPFAIYEKFMVAKESIKADYL